MPNCSSCGESVTALHTNGTLGIVEVCSRCFPVLADAAAKRKVSRPRVIWADDTGGSTPEA